MKNNKFIYFTLSIFIIFFLSNFLALASFNSIVNKNNWISDYKTRLILAEILSYNDSTLDQSLYEYKKLLQIFPNKYEIQLKIAKIYSKQGKLKKYNAIIQKLYKNKKEDISFIVRLANLESALGHAKKCLILYQKALKISPNNEKILLDLANHMNMWGNFYKIEKFYKSYLKKYPDANTIWLKLANTYASSQQYEKAQVIYNRLLLQDKDINTSLFGLINLKIMEKNFKSALNQIGYLLEKNPDNYKAIFLKAKLLSFEKKYDESINTFKKLIDSKKYKIESILEIGKICLKKNEIKLAKRYFNLAYKYNPKNIEANFYKIGLNNVATDKSIKFLLKLCNSSTKKLYETARIYAANGFYNSAILFSKKALKKDPEYFPAQIGIAELYASIKEYNKAIKTYKKLSLEYPGDSKILISLARVLAWSKQYEKALNVYDKILNINPNNSVIIIEKARTALWEKEPHKAWEFYDSLLSPSVDKKLLKYLSDSYLIKKNKNFKLAAEKIENELKNGSIYQGYELFLKHFKLLKKSLFSDDKKNIEEELNYLSYYFLIQKKVYLEKKAKYLYWQKHYLHAIDAYENLLTFTPGNQEAIFDYGQIECILGLCNKSEKIYDKLIDIDQNNVLAKSALSRIKRKKNLSILLNNAFWQEKGRDGLTDIDKNITDIGFNVPMFCRFNLNIKGIYWDENPKNWFKAYQAYGGSFLFSGPINEFIKAEFNWTYKRYSDKSLSLQNTGFVNLWFNLYDYTTLGLGYNRANEIHNGFGILQGTQANKWWLSIDSNITKDINIKGESIYLQYNDDNNGQKHFLLTGYSFSDYPRIFKTSLYGEYQDTKYLDKYIYESDVLTNIIHPYWTPNNYLSGNIIFEWYHDISKFFFCEAQHHYYDIKLSIGTDTEDNPMVELSAEWNYEFLDHVAINLKGMMHQSRLWDANGVWATIKYTF